MPKARGRDCLKGHGPSLVHQIIIAVITPQEEKARGRGDINAEYEFQHEGEQSDDSDCYDPFQQQVDLVGYGW